MSIYYEVWSKLYPFPCSVYWTRARDIKEVIFPEIVLVSLLLYRVNGCLSVSCLPVGENRTWCENVGVVLCLFYVHSAPADYSHTTVGLSWVISRNILIDCARYFGLSRRYICFYIKRAVVTGLVHHHRRPLCARAQGKGSMEKKTEKKIQQGAPQTW